MVAELRVWSVSVSLWGNIDARIVATTWVLAIDLERILAVQGCKRHG